MTRRLSLALLAAALCVGAQSRNERGIDRSQEGMMEAWRAKVTASKCAQVTGDWRATSPADLVLIITGTVESPSCKGAATRMAKNAGAAKVENRLSYTKAGKLAAQKLAIKLTTGRKETK
jgi:hypothetical protein